MTTIEFRGQSVPVTVAAPCDAELAVRTPLFQGWLAGLDLTFDLRGIEIQSVDAFSTGRVGFIKFAARVERRGVRIPGIVVLRGQAVALLIVITDADTGEEFAILTEQPRVPTGRVLLEIPAGMVDGEGNLRGVAVKELEEECGIAARTEDLVDLVELAFGGTAPGIFMSGGLCDESIRLYLWRVAMPHARVAELEGRLGGADAHEQITLRIVRFADVWRLAPDAKSLSSLALYANLRAAGRLP